MQLIDLRKASGELFNKSLELYKTSFPTFEIRSESSLRNALTDTEYNPKVAIDNEGNLMAIIFFWLHGDLLYIEHLAVDIELRGQNIGTRLLDTITEQYADKTIILEIDPPVDEISIRRLGFYERAGFVSNGYEFIHPSFTKGSEAHPHKLILMTYGKHLTENGFSAFKHYLFETPLKYID